MMLQEGLERVEAGAQGEHKIARGFMPSPTYSAHYIPGSTSDPGGGWPGGGFAALVGRYLAQERADMEETMRLLHREASPYKVAPAAPLEQ